MRLLPPGALSNYDARAMMLQCATIRNGLFDLRTRGETVKRGYFKWRVIPYCSNISETTETFELNVVGYNVL